MLLTHPLDTDVFQLITEVGTDPAAGADYTYTPPANCRIQLLSFTFTFATDANAANRLARFRILNATNRAVTVLPLIKQTASKTWTYHFAPGVPAYEQQNLHQLVWGNLGHAFIMQDGDTLEINSPSMQATDQISDILLRYKLWTME